MVILEGRSTLPNDGKRKWETRETNNKHINQLKHLPRKVKKWGDWNESLGWASDNRHNWKIIVFFLLLTFFCRKVWPFLCYAMVLGFWLHFRKGSMAFVVVGCPWQTFQTFFHSNRQHLWPARVIMERLRCSIEPSSNNLVKKKKNCMKSEKKWKINWLIE